MVLKWRVDGEERSLIIEFDGNYHYYSAFDRIASHSTEFKYRLFDLYNLPYLRLECWDFIIEEPPSKSL